LSYKAFL